MPGCCCGNRRVGGWSYKNISWFNLQKVMYNSHIKVSNNVGCLTKDGNLISLSPPIRILSVKLLFAIASKSSQFDSPSITSWGSGIPLLSPLQSLNSPANQSDYETVMNSFIITLIKTQRP